MIKAIIGMLGFLFLFPKIKDLLLYLFNLVQGPRRNLAEIYGQKSYVLITGGSEGIGEAIGHEFARRGFNLILISRSQEKLQLAKERLRQKFPKCDVVLVAFNFSDIDKKECWDLDKTLGLDFSKLDVSIVVNNVGISGNLSFYNSTEEELKELVKINCVSQVLVTRVFIPRFLKRKRRSAFLNVSSLSAVNSNFAAPVYGATKRFNLHFSESIGNFYENIDVYTFTPGFVYTSMIKSFAHTLGPHVIGVEDCAACALKHFGSYRYLFSGHWKHELISLILRAIPTAVFRFAFKRRSRRATKESVNI